MLLKAVFDKTAFVKFKIRINQPMDLKNLKKKSGGPKFSRVLPNVCDFPKENHTLGYGYKNI
jgi:hypothetical protein